MCVLKDAVIVHNAEVWKVLMIEVNAVYRDAEVALSFSVAVLT